MFRSVLLTALLLGGLLCPAQKFSIVGKAIPFRVLLDSIQQKTGYSYLCREDILREVPPLDLDCHDLELGPLLDSVLLGFKLDHTIANHSFTILRSPRATGLYRDLVGIVVDTAGSPLLGATISINGVARQYMRDDGFRLRVQTMRTQVTVSCIGYTTRQLVLSNQARQVVILATSASPLDKAVVRAYGKTTPRLTTNSITVVPDSTIQPGSGGSVEDALEGRVPGLFVRQWNGVPGSAREMLIRGQHSLADGNNMLVVIDGVPYVDNDGYLTVIGSGSAQGSNGASVLNAIPPDDIASLEILKGAAATAIYGSRGANGVLLITLKTGKVGKPRWDAGISSGVDHAVKVSRLLNTREYFAMREEAVGNDGDKPGPDNIPEATAWDSNRYTNYQQFAIGQTRWRQDAHVGLTGGDSNTVYLISGSYHREAAVYPGSWPDERKGVFGRLHQQSRDRKLQIDLSAIYHWENNRLPIQDFSAFQWLAPNAPPFTTTGGQLQWNYNGLAYLNIPAQGYLSYTGAVQNTFDHLQLSYALAPGLELRGGFGYSAITGDENSQVPIIGQDPATNPTGSTLRFDNHGNSELVEGSAVYKKTWGRSQLEAIAGADWQQLQTRYSVTQVNGFTSDALMASGGGNPTVSIMGNKVVYRYEALFGRLNYILDNRYIVEVSGRRDGSSRFGPGDQFGNFWAGSGGWIFGDERWFRSWSWLSFGKLRASLGTTGNDQLYENYAQVYQGTTAPTGYQGQQGLVPATLANNKLRWEVNYNSEWAVDLGLLQNRVLLTVAAYRDWTVNQLVQTRLPSQSGLPSAYSNLPADIINRGVEVSLHTVNWSGRWFSWTSTVTFTAPLNRLQRFPGLGTTSYAGSLVVGKSLSVVKGFQYQGVSVDSGLFQFRGLEHGGQLTDSDLVVGANLDPRYYGGVDQWFTYKRLELEVFVEFRRQNGYNPFVVLYQVMTPGSLGPSMLGNVPVEWLRRWKASGDHAALEQVTNSDATLAAQRAQDFIASDAQATDASFIRCRRVALTWRMPDAWLKRMHMREGKLYLRADNLFTITPFPVTDPETQNPMVLPPMRSISFGLQANF